MSALVCLCLQTAVVLVRLYLFGLLARVHSLYVLSCVLITPFSVLLDFLKVLFVSVILFLKPW